MENNIQAHTTTGIRKILELPFFHNLWQHVSGVERAKKKIIKEYLKPADGMRILDIGCGTGVILNYIDANLKYVGFDINPDYIEHAKNQFKNRGEFHCVSVNDSDIYGNEFDFAIAIGILHHLDNKESEELIKSAKKHLKKDGCLLMVEPVWTDKQSKLEKYLMSKDRGQNIRTQQEYLGLLDKYFDKTENIIRADMLNIPWTLSITKSYQ